MSMRRSHSMITNIMLVVYRINGVEVDFGLQNEGFRYVSRDNIDCRTRDCLGRIGSEVDIQLVSSR